MDIAENILDDIDIKTYFPGKIICVGMNYRSHVDEQDGRFPSTPVLFAKASSCIVKDGDNIVYPPEVGQLDYEVELAAVIGKKARNIEPGDVSGYIYGYTVFNDVTARDLQKSDGQWYRAKSFDTFGSVGPAVIKQEGLGDPQDINLRSYVNSEMRQDGNTSDMIFGVYDLISFISRSITLLPGDLIATGTPSGVGIFTKGDKLLKPGDVVTCEIEGIGSITNTVVNP